MANQLPIIALDLDFTLARFQHGYIGIYNQVEKFGISRSLAETELRNHIDSPEGLQFEKYAESLMPKQSKGLSGALEKHFKADFCWYPEVRSTLEFWRGLGIPLILVTAGSITLQKQKIQLLGFPFDEVYITAPLQGKADAIGKILKKYPGKNIIYIDDKVAELTKIANDPFLSQSPVKFFCISYGDRKQMLSDEFPNISSLIEAYPTGKLGFFDSGIGGLTVMQEFQKLYPDLDFEYFGDSKNCPYGDRSPQEILTLVIHGVEELVHAGCTIVILACNTAVAHAVRYLQQEKYPKGGPIKILGVTLPGAEKVVELGLHYVGILATQATVNNRAYRDRVHLLNPQIIVTEIAVPGLVNLIETEHQDTEAIHRLLHDAIIQFDADIEALVLGCTHYPLVSEQIRIIWEAVHGTKIRLIDPGQEAALRFGDYMKRHPELILSHGGTSRIKMTK